MPPALRWEVGTDGPIFSREALTRERLYTSLGVQSSGEMTDHQRRYCRQYHRAMVEPFINNQRWTQLMISAGDTWRYILAKFDNLETIEVASCERTNQPWGTSTHSFVLEHGKSVLNEESPAYVEDDTINKGWASALLLTQLPTQNLRACSLTWAQTDNLNSFATVNRLLTSSYEMGINVHNSLTHLDLTLEGVYGTHGSRDWHGNTGTAGGVRFWKRAINAMTNLQSLTLRDDLSHDEDKMFTSQEMTDAHGHPMEWLLHGIINKSLRTLRLEDLELNHWGVDAMLTTIPAALTTLVLVDCVLVDRKDDDESINRNAFAERHILGYTWEQLCNRHVSCCPERLLRLVRPVSNSQGHRNYCLHATVVEQIVRYYRPRVSLDLRYYEASVHVPPDQPTLSS